MYIYLCTMKLYNIVTAVRHSKINELIVIVKYVL